MDPNKNIYIYNIINLKRRWVTIRILGEGAIAFRRLTWQHDRCSSVAQKSVFELESLESAITNQITTFFLGGKFCFINSPMYLKLSLFLYTTTTTHYKPSMKKTNKKTTNANLKLFGMIFWSSMNIWRN